MGEFENDLYTSTFILYWRGYAMGALLSELLKVKKLLVGQKVKG